MRWTSAVVWVVLCSCGRGQEQKPMPKNALPSYEVVTVKPSDPADQSQGFQTRGRRVIAARNQSVISLIMFAYGVHKKQIVDAPAWLDERFDVNGVPDVEGEPNLPQMQHLFQGVLADRFKMRFHREKRNMPIYALRVLKGPVKISMSKDQDAVPDQTGNGSSSEQTMVFTNNTMDDFALGMQYFMDRPVVNQTELSGRWDFKLRWSFGLVPKSSSDVPGMFTAIQEQAGLKLEATRGAAEVLVIQQVAKPPEN